MNLIYKINSLPQLLVFVASLSLGLFVLLKNPKSPVNRSFAFLAFIVSIRHMLHAIYINISDPILVLPWALGTYYLIAFFSSATYHFVVSFLNLKKRRTILLFYFFSFLLTFFIRDKNFITGIKYFSWGSFPQAGYIQTIFAFLWAIPFIAALEELYRKYKTTESPYVKGRIKYLLVTLLIAYLGVVDYLPCYGADVYPFGLVFILFFICTTTYAIVRYRLMDIKVIVTKVSLAASAFIAAVTLLYFLTFYLQQYLYDLFGKSWIFIPVSVSFLVSYLLFYFIRFVRQIEEAEISKKYAYRPLLRREAARMSSVGSMNELLAYVTRDLSSLVHLDYIGIFIWDAQGKDFVLVRSLTRNKKRKQIPIGIRLTQDNPIVVELLRRRRRQIIYSEIEHDLESKVALYERKDSVVRLAGQLQLLGIEVSIPCFCEEKLLAIINLGRKLDADEVITDEDLELFHFLSGQFARTVHDFMLKEEKIKLIVASQNILIGAVEAKDKYTRGHTDRVAVYCVQLGKKLEKQLRAMPDCLSQLNWAAQLHDIGKIAIADSILLKPELLDNSEWVIVREHPVNGIKIVGPMREWLGEDICAGILHHHENYDGTGYPGRLSGNNIHIFARIIRVADSFDAMTTNRPYRPALSREQALAELRLFRGTYYDPLVIDAAEELLKT